MHENVQKSTSTTLPCRPEAVSAGPLSHVVAPLSAGNRPSTGSTWLAAEPEASGVAGDISPGPALAQALPAPTPRPRPSVLATRTDSSVSGFTMASMCWLYRPPYDRPSAPVFDCTKHRWSRVSGSTCPFRLRD